MIIYGTNGAHVRTEPAPGLACPACAQPAQVELSVYSRYVHIYWVPLVPYRKPVVAHCRHCQAAWERAELPADAPTLRAAARELGQRTRAPWWQWSGLVLLVGGLLWGWAAASQDGRDNAAYLAAPRVGDVYTVRDSASAARYSLLKVVRAQGNTVELVANEYDLDNAHPLDALNDPEKYGKEPFTLTQLDLKLMQNKGQLTDVDRLGE